MPSQLPHFIREHLIHSTVLHLSRKHRSTLALLKNLQFYEIHNKQVLNFIDLQNTILTRIQHKLQSIVPEVNGAQSQASDILGSSFACPSYSADEVIFGKYIYQNIDDKKVYILLKCWDLLVVIRKDPEGFVLQAEYEDVHSFKMRKGSNYQVQLVISCLHGEDVLTNFQDILAPTVLPKVNTYRKTIENIRMKRSELLVHKTITKQEFARLKSTNVFGCNMLRTPRLEEMQILSKCGDAWVKVTADHDVVIGVPLVNNCSSRLTILRNLRGVLRSPDNSEDLSYKFTLYQSDKRLSDMKNIQSFLQAENTKQHNVYSWSQCTELCLRPEAFYVLLLTVKINELSVSNSVKVPLFVFYDILEADRTFPQKCCITMLSFQQIFTSDTCRLNFHENYLQRDLLTVISTSYESNALLEHSTSSCAFEDYLCRQIGFDKVSFNQNCSETMHVDQQDTEDNDVALEKALFYNKNPGSVWYGTLLVITSLSDLCFEAKLYTKTQEKSKVFFSMLHTELRTQCGIKEIRCNARSLSSKLIGFEAALRDECCAYVDISSSSAMKMDSTDIIKKQQQLHSYELKTDIQFKSLES